MNYNGPKVKLSRKLSLELTPKSGKYTSRKPYPPGQHGASKKRAKQSDFGRQLLEKQRLRLQYNVSEKQMHNYYVKATQLTGNTGELLVQLLETRLDNYIYRAGFARTIYASRQFVSHGHILVNGKRCSIPSYQVKTTDLIAVKLKSQKIEQIQESIRSTHPPAYIEVSKVDLSSRLQYVPPREEIPAICEISLVVEYYSR